MGKNLNICTTACSIDDLLEDGHIRSGPELFPNIELSEKPILNSQRAGDIQCRWFPAKGTAQNKQKTSKGMQSPVVLGQ